MAYIYLDELKEILPDIFNEWMDGGDESWEWIFQEIEQKCHIGKKKKDKKKQKKYAEYDIDSFESKIDEHLADHRNDINELSAKIINLSKIVDELSKQMLDRVRRMDQDINVAKSMAQTAKQRTEIDYSNISKIKSDAEVIQEVYNRMSGRGATREELDTFRNLIHKYDALEKKEIPVIKKSCETCKYVDRGDCSPCTECHYNSINLSGLNKWEAKDE